jgi:hypothetical protein
VGTKIDYATWAEDVGLDLEVEEVTELLETGSLSVRTNVGRYVLSIVVDVETTIWWAS